MSTKSNIEWTNTTWNPMVGCTKVSPGCANCYAINESRRVLLRVSASAKFPRGLATQAAYAEAVTNDSKPPRWTGTIGLMEHKLHDPFNWKEPRMVFVNSMSDLFHEDVPFDFIDQVFAVMALTPQHTYQVLTKRPERMLEYFEMPARGGRVGCTTQRMQGKPGIPDPSDSKGLHEVAQVLTRWPLPNVWLGTSVEDQKTADERIPYLLKCPAAMRWLSCEPLLGEVTLMCRHTGDALYAPSDDGSDNTFIDWVVAGGESGPDARPMHPDWVRSLRDQCAGLHTPIPFFFKQWGAWRPLMAGEGILTGPDRCRVVYEGKSKSEMNSEGLIMRRVGKKRAGRLLDGVEHNAYPEIQS